MKKRVKLLTTIASLCLAVALMAFGVYAAQTASFTVGSKVSFSANGFLSGTLKVTAYKNATATENAEATGVSDEETITSNTASGQLTIANVDLDPNNRWIVYVVEFTKATGNTASEDATITISELKQNAVALTETTTETWYASDVDATGTSKVVFGVYYGADATLQESPITFTVTLSC